MSVNTGRISVTPPHSASPLLNFSIDELQTLLPPTSPLDPSSPSLRGSVLDPVLALGSEERRGVLCGMRAFVKQWAPLRAYDKRVRTPCHIEGSVGISRNS